MSLSLTIVRRATVLPGMLAALALAVAAPTAQAAAPARTTGACTTTVTGDLPGTQTVAAGDKLCLRNASVGGAITVEPGGSLASRNSSVNGAITLAAANNFKFCGSSSGAISASGGVGSLRIGDNHKCAGNRIVGAITVQSYADRVTLARTKTTGDVVINSNAAESGKAPTVSGNKIGGSLSCSANAPTPTNAGHVNDVYGAKSGQCAGTGF